jgi:hypothetical protein
MNLVARICLALTLAGLPSVGVAAQESGVILPDSVSVAGKPLMLNGIGVRTKTFLRIKVYVAGLYLEAKSNSATQILAADSARRLELRMTHKSPRPRIVGELSDGFERSAQGKLSSLKPRLDKLLGAVTDLDEGQSLVLTYLPDQGTTIQCSGGRAVSVPGKDFADATFAIWLGTAAIDDDLKRQLLGSK